MDRQSISRLSFKRTLLSLTALALSVACVLPLTPGASWAAVRVPGTRVTLNPPPGFTASTRFPGFERADRGASIMVTELPGSAKEMEKGMTKEALATRGMNLIRSQKVKAGVLLHVSQSAAGTEFLKWMLIGGDTKQTVMVVGTFPKTAADLNLPVRTAVMSASWGGKVTAPPFEGLSFRADATPTLKLAGRVANALVFTESGSMGPSGDPKQALLVFGSSLAEVAIDNVETFARERATKSTQVGPLRNVVGRAVKTDGLPGYELVAEANDVKTGRAVRMYQLVLVDGGTYYLAQGFVAADRPPVVLDQFRQVTGSFRRLRKG